MLAIDIQGKEGGEGGCTWLAADAVGGIFVGDFDTVHGLRVGVEPDCAVGCIISCLFST